MQHIVKRRGHWEKFDERKIYASCYRACLSTQLHPVVAEEICGKVCIHMRKWIKTKKVVSSNHIFKETTRAMKKHHKEAAFMYETHRDIS